MPLLLTIWPGKNRFYCGCCITGPIQDCPASLCWYICALMILAIYSAFILRPIWINVTPTLPIIFLLSIAVTTVFHSLTACTDPGIIPRRPILQFLNKSNHIPLFQNNQQQTLNHCTTCNIYRPLRTSHCSVCNNCVQIFDHHCPFVNNCIGKRNYRFFILFVAGVICSLGTAIINALIYIISLNGTDIDSTAAVVICSIVFGIIAVPLVVFLAFHVYLAVKGKTTREVLKRLESNVGPRTQWCNVDEPWFDPFMNINEGDMLTMSGQLGY